MPTSNPDFVTMVCQSIMNINPLSVLDVGIGFGKYGFLAREYTDVCRERYFQWQTRIDGIEIFEPYVLEIQRKIYDNIYIADAIEVLSGRYPPITTNKDVALDPNMVPLSKYDLVIASDILEHYDKEKGYECLELIKKRSMHAIIICPMFPSNQQPIYGNEFERHKSKWELEELQKFGNVITVNRMFLLEISDKVFDEVRNKQEIVFPL